MADKDIKIEIKTTADVKAVKVVEEAIEEVVKETNNQGAAAEKTAEKTTKGAKRVVDAIEEIENATQDQGDEARKTGRDTEMALDKVEESAEDVRRELDKIDGIKPEARKQVEDYADSLDTAATKGRAVGGAQKVAGRQTRNTSLAFLEFSRAVEDAQYGVRGILNNIPQMVLLMGGGGGLAGVISIAAVGLTQLFERMAATKEPAGAAAEALQEVIDKLTDVRKESNDANFAIFVDSVERAKAATDLQNESMRISIGLLVEQRQAALEVAAAQDDLERARIAQRVLTDPDFSQTDAQVSLSALDLSAMERDQQEQIRVANDKILSARQAERAIAETRVIELGKRDALEEQALAVAKKIAELDRLALDAKFLEMEVEKNKAQRANESLTALSLDNPIARTLENTFAAVLNVTSGGAIDPARKEKKSDGFRRDAEIDLERLRSFNAGDAANLEASRAALTAISAELAATKERLVALNQETLRAAQVTAGVKQSAENAEETIGLLTDLKVQTEIAELETATALQEARSVIAPSFEAIKAEVSSLGITLSQGEQESLARIEEISRDALDDSMQRAEFEKNLRVLQRAGIDATNRLIGVVDQGIQENRALQGRIKNLEDRMNALAARK